MRLTVIAVLVLAGMLLLGSNGAVAVEQTITPLTPPHEQQIELLSAQADDQGVDAIASADDAQQISAPVPPTPAEKAASTAGKFVLGVTGAAVALGAMAASLLFI